MQIFTSSQKMCGGGGDLYKIAGYAFEIGWGKLTLNKISCHNLIAMKRDLSV